MPSTRRRWNKFQQKIYIHCYKLACEIFFAGYNILSKKL